VEDFGKSAVIVRVGDVFDVGIWDIIQQTREIDPELPPDFINIFFVHEENVIIVFEVSLRQPLGALAGKLDIVLGQLGLSSRMRRLVDMPVAGGCGGDVEVLGEALFGDEVFKDTFGHGGAADIAHANEEDGDFFHGYGYTISSK